MSVLRKEGKEKLHFKIMNKAVSNQDFKRLKKIALDCLNENPTITEKIDENYKIINVYFFYEATDQNVDISSREALADPERPYIARPIIATTQALRNLGLILVFLKRLKEDAQRRTNIDNDRYFKNVLLEEFCHLVEMEGDGDLFPGSHHTLWELYRRKGLQDFGDQILDRLDSVRDHYTVFSLMLKACPNDFVNRFSTYYSEKPEQYKEQYEIWKKTTPIKIAHARLITGFLRSTSFLFVLAKAKKETLTAENNRTLEKLLLSGQEDLASKRMLIEKEIGCIALALIDSVDESVFQSTEAFFAVILDLWLNLKLV
jgi:hypothetical protein